MELTMRDVRIVRDTLLATGDWDDAGDLYAQISGGVVTVKCFICDLEVKFSWYLLIFAVVCLDSTMFGVRYCGSS
jgi:hypothetical protein